MKHLREQGRDGMGRKNGMTTKQRSLRNMRKMHLIAMIFLSLLFLTAILLMVRYHVLSKTFSAVNSGVSLVSMIFAILLLGCCSVGDYGGGRDQSFFAALVMLECMILFSDHFVFVVSGEVNLRALIYLVCLINNILLILYWLGFWFYLRSFFPPDRKDTILTILIALCCAAYLIVSLFGAITGLFFYVDELGFVVYNGIDFSTLIFLGLWMGLYLYRIFTYEGIKATKISLAIYAFFPLISGILSFIWFQKGLPYTAEAIVDACCLFPLYIIFFNVYVNRGRQLVEQERELNEKKTQIMLSQISPHFLYNALGTISALAMIEGAEKTTEATDKFAEYLRGNLDSLKSEAFIPFEKELNHIKTYLWIEQLRFGDRLDVVYDIRYTDFKLPPLVVQPLVENAVKHGLCPKEQGGTVSISTEKMDGDAIITVSDDGVGFDMEQRLQDGRSHVGLSNVRDRLRSLDAGFLVVRSEIGRGTTVVIRIKGRSPYENSDR